MCLLRLKQSLNICGQDFESYLIGARDSGFIKFDPMLVARLRNNNPGAWVICEPYGLLVHII